MKSILNKYLAKHILSAIGAVALMLVGLQMFMLFVAEMGAIGQGDYGVINAFLFVLLQLPYHVYLFFPVACLLGVLLGLGMLANNSELLVMRSSGISPSNIAGLTFRTVGALVLLVVLIGEFSFPKLIHFSEEWKASHRSGGQTIRTDNGLWLRQDLSFIHIEHAESVQHLKGVHQYKFNDKHQLILARFINEANYINGNWLLKKVKETHFTYLKGKPQSTTTYIKIDQSWPLNLSPHMLIGSDKDPNEMSLLELHRLIKVKRRAHLDPGHFEMNYWRRIFQPLATFVMVLLALPFIFGSIRSFSIGQRFLVGAGVGFLFHLLNEFAIPVSQIFQVPPILAALLPILFFMIIGIVLIKRVR